jgi:hypothetical protein
MDAKEILTKLRQAFNEFATPAPAPAPSPAPAPQNLEGQEYTTADGQKIMVTVLEVGGVVTIMDEAGGQVPAPAGELTLEDGTVIVVAEGGAIGEVRTAAPAAPAPSEFETKMAAFEQTTTQKFSEYEEKFAAYEQKFTEYEEKLSKAEKVIGGLLDLTNLLAEEPQAKPDPAASAPTNFKEDKKAAKKEELHQFASALFNKKKNN